MPSALGALIVKNFKLKFNDKRTLVLEILIPCVLAWIFSTLGGGWNGVPDHVDPNPYTMPVANHTIAEAAYDLGSFGRWYNAVAFIHPAHGREDPHHPLVAEIVAMHADYRYQAQNQGYDGSYNFSYVTYKSVEDITRHNKKNRYNYDHDIVDPLYQYEILSYVDLSKIPTDPAQIPKDAKGKKIYDYTIISDSIDTKYQPWDVFDLASERPKGYKSWVSPYYGLQTMMNYAILRQGGYAQGIANATQFDTITLTTQDMPVRDYYESYSSYEVNMVVCGVFSLSFAASFVSVVSLIVYEKEAFIWPLLLITGGSRFQMYLSYFITQFAILFVPIIIGVCFVVLAMYKTTHLAFILVYFLFYYVAVIAFACFLSTFFVKQRNATSVSAFVFVVLSGLAIAAYWLPPQILDFLMVFNFQNTLHRVNVTWYYFTEHTDKPGGEFGTPFAAAAPNGISILVACGLHLFQCALYLLLTCYLEMVLPGEYSTPLPFYFPLLPSYWRAFFNNGVDSWANRNVEDNRTALLGQNQTDYNTIDMSASGDNQSLFGSPGTPQRLIQPLTAQEKNRVGVKFVNVKKQFKTENGVVRAVDDLSLAFLRGSVNMLLGANGSGKSTSVNMMTNLYAPTSGTIEIYNAHGEKFANPAGHIGVCPQYNACYEKLTVLDNILLFSQIKQHARGITINKADVLKEAVVLLNKFKMGPKRDNKMDAVVSTLSGGTKRKLCLILALLHDPAVLVVDEGTSGVDLTAAREIQDVLRHVATEGNGKTVVMLTHDMSEAETGNRLNILAEGKLMCSGTPMFLKNAFNVGYLLQLNKTKQVGVFDRLDDVVVIDHNDTTQARFISATSDVGLHLNTINTQSGKAMTTSLFTKLPADIKSSLRVHADTQHHITYSFPMEQGDQIPTLLQIAEDCRAELSATDVGLSITTLNDVFLMANPKYIQQYMRATAQTAGGDTPVLDSSADLPQFATHRNINLDTTLWDREREQVHPITVFFHQFIALFRKRMIIQWRNRWSLVMLFILPIVLMGLVYSLSAWTNTGPLMNLDMKYAPQDTPYEYSVLTEDATLHPFHHNANIFAKTVAEQHTRAKSYPRDWDNVIPDENSPYYRPFVLVNQTEWGQSMASNYDNYTLHNPRFFAVFSDKAEFDTTTHTADATIVLAHNSTQYYTHDIAVNLVFETLAEALGLSPISIQYSLQGIEDKLSAHIIRALIVAVVCLCALIFPLQLINFLIKERMEKTKHLHLISGVSSLAYWSAYFVFDYIIYTLMVGLMTAGIAITSPESPLGWIFAGLMTYGIHVLWFTYALSFLFDKPFSGQVGLTLILTLGPFVILGVAMAILITSQIYAGWETVMRIAFAVPSAGLVYSMVVFLWTKQTDDVWQEGNKVVFIWLSIAPVFLVCLIAFQIIHNRKLIEQLFGSVLLMNDEEGRQRDEDVVAEENFVQNTDWSPQDYPLVASRLHKTFKNFTAVNDLSFTVPKQSIVGLLGANGSGKSTTLSLLTHDLWLSKSVESSYDAFICGKSIKTDPSAAYKFLGFCPQFDALNLELTARQTLTLYANFRSVWGQDCEQYVNDLLHVLGLEHAADRAARGYSLGMRRRLSLGLALVGSPAVVILDECSTGCDPQSKLNIQLLLQQTCKNRSVLMTSHSLDEIESLCDKICFMQKGEMKAVGSKAQLKEKLGNEFSIVLEVEQCFEDFVAIHLLNQLTNVVIPTQLSVVLEKHVESLLLHKKQYEDADTTTTTTTNHNNTKSITEQIQDFQQNPHYVAFMTDVAQQGAARIVEQRTRHLEVNVKKQKFTLQQVFAKVNEAREKIDVTLKKKNVINAYSAAQVSMQQVFTHLNQPQRISPY